MSRSKYVSVGNTGGLILDSKYDDFATNAQLESKLGAIENKLAALEQKLTDGSQKVQLSIAQMDQIKQRIKVPTPNPPQIYPDLVEHHSWVPVCADIARDKILAVQGPQIREYNNDFSDPGGSVSIIYSFNTEHPEIENPVIDMVGVLSNGSIIASLRYGTTQPASVWVSNPEKTVFTKTHEAHALGVRYDRYWGHDSHGNIVVLSEYGAQGVATRAYLSVDYGVTWREIFDLSEHVSEPSSAHIHSICYDPWWSRIWVSTGDTSTCRGIWYSDNWGDTWVRVTNQYQPTSIIAMENCILFGADGLPGGIWRINRERKNKVLTTEDIQIAYIPEAHPETLNNLRLLATTFNRKDYNSPVYTSWQFQFSAGGVSTDSGLIIATKDGYNFYEVFKDWNKYPVGYGVVNAFETSDNYLVGVLTSPDHTGYRFLHPAPTWE